jgi:hypothetical protein
MAKDQISASIYARKDIGTHPSWLWTREDSQFLFREGQK